MASYIKPNGKFLEAYSANVDSYGFFRKFKDWTHGVYQRFVHGNFEIPHSEGDSKIDVFRKKLDDVSSRLDEEDITAIKGLMNARRKTNV